MLGTAQSRNKKMVPALRGFSHVAGNLQHLENVSFIVEQVRPLGATIIIVKSILNI